MNRLLLALAVLLASIGVANTAGQKVSPIDVTACSAGNFVNEVTAAGVVNCGTPAAITSANPTATAKDTAVNGAATTFMRSDAAPAIQKASASQFGIIEVDGSTITASGGVLSAVGAGTQPPGGSSGNLQTNNGSGGFGAFAGTSCTNQFPRSLNASGAATCASVANTDLANSTITLNAGSSTGLTAPGAMSLGSTYTIGATSDTPRFAGLGLGGAATGANQLAIFGGTSGRLVFAVPAAAGTNTITFPAGTTDFSATGGTSQFVKQASTGAALTVARPACADLSDSGAGCSGSASSGGTVTSVALSVPGSSIFGTTGTPVTTTGTLGLTVTGTSGGVPYFDTTSTLSSSAALTANRLVLGGGAGAAPAVLGSLGTTTTVLHGNAAGAPSFGEVANADLTNSTISGVALGSTLAALTATDTTLTFSGSYTGATARTVGLNLANNNTWTKGQAVTPSSLSISGGSVAVDASLSNNFTLTANGAFTLANPSNLLAGQTLNFWITQDGTGGRVMTLGSQYQAAGGSSALVLSTAVSTKDLLTCVSDTTSTLTCALVKAIAH